MCEMRFDEWAVTGFDRDAAVGLVKHGLNPLASVFMCSRGITQFDDAIDFITDKPTDINDPMLLDDMDKAAERIERALASDEKITVFGDYDVDGMTSSALMKSYLSSRGARCDIYIPSRADEGYGLNRPALDYLKERGTELVITVDCGITAIEETEYAKQLGIDVIITDHHECRERLPDAVAVIDPKREGSKYPNRSLAGVGVAFKVVCALEGEKCAAALLREYGDLVAIGTIADVMPVTGENRALIRAGMTKLTTSPRPGLSVLIKAACASQNTINTATIGFSLAPRLNAAGRMGKTMVSVELLLTNDRKEAERLSDELVELNNQRRELESGIFEEVERILGCGEQQGPIVMADENWYHGVMGIVAARTAERWMTPAIMINLDEDGIGRGSCRSYGGFFIYTALKKCSDLLINYGGHEMAAGITIERDKIDEFRERIQAIYKEEVKGRKVSSLYIDFEVEKPKLLELPNVEALGRLEPFGNGNFPPHMMICSARVAQLVAVGAGKHTRLRIDKDGALIDCIYFGAETCKLGIREGSIIDVAFEPQINEFRGRRNVQLHVIDLRRAEQATIGQ